jgi:sugar fermentation stimulation protein A
MYFENNLQKATIKKRYKRFLADCLLEDGTEIVAHVPNTGSMKTCWESGWDVLLSFHDNPKRKLKYTLELIHNGKSWICVNTSLPNKIVQQAILNHEIEELIDFTDLKCEVKYGSRNSRIDILLETGLKKTYVEVKNVTMISENDFCLFPDAVSARGKKHLDELIDMVAQGHRAVMFYLVNREDCSKFRPAWEIDSDYSNTLILAEKAGVELLVYQTKLSEKKIEINKKLEIYLNEKA